MSRECILSLTKTYKLNKGGKQMKIFRQFLIVLVIAFSGEIINHFLKIPIPGNVIAMILLLILLSKGVIKLKMIDQAAKFMLDHLAIFFIPAGVSLINNLELLKNELFAILTIVVISTVVIMVVTGLTIQFIKE